MAEDFTARNEVVYCSLVGRGSKPTVSSVNT